VVYFFFLASSIFILNNRGITTKRAIMSKLTFYVLMKELLCSLEVKILILLFQNCKLLYEKEETESSDLMTLLSADKNP